MTVPEEEAAANYVPAAAVIRRQQALFGITGRKECVGGAPSLVSKIKRFKREFDPGSESTLAARLTHASRTRKGAILSTVAHG